MCMWCDDTFILSFNRVLYRKLQQLIVSYACLYDNYACVNDTMELWEDWLELPADQNP